MSVCPEPKGGEGLKTVGAMAKLTSGGGGAGAGLEVMKARGGDLILQV